MNTQDIVNLARTRGYTDSTQLTDPFAVLCLSMLYKDCRSRLNQFVAEDFATDTFNIPMILGQNTYSIPVGMDQVVSATVDYYPSGQSYPVRMGIRRFSSLPNAPDYYLLRQALTDPFYVIWGTQLKIYPQPQTLAYTFTVSGVTVSPSPGNTYTNNSGTFRILSVSITAGSGTIVAIPINTIVPTASGTLVRTSGV